MFPLFTILQTIDYQIILPHVRTPIRSAKQYLRHPHRFYCTALSETTRKRKIFANKTMQKSGSDSPPKFIVQQYRNSDKFLLQNNIKTLPFSYR